MAVIKIFVNGTVLYKNKLQAIEIAVSGGKIVAVGSNLCREGAEIADCKSKYILPALFDIHTHGAAGFDFNTATENEMLQILNFYAARGVKNVLPTVMTDTDGVILQQLARIAQLAKTHPEIKGIHLEGPFLSPEFCGAMPKNFLQLPNVEKFFAFQKAAEGLIKIVTVAPELPGAENFTRLVSKSGVVVSLGHSAADFDTAQKCLDCGAASFTHTFNAMRQLIQRQPGILGAALTSKCFCEIIADGKHVHPQNVKLLVKAKGAGKIICITDSMMAAGMPDGDYKLGQNAVTVQNADAFITGTTTRAGSTLTADAALVNIMRFCNLPLPQAIKTLTENPARLLGLFDRTGSIEIGKDADLWVCGNYRHKLSV